LVQIISTKLFFVLRAWQEVRAMVRWLPLPALYFSILAQAAKQGRQPDDASKMAAVDKVITMLTDLQATVQAEGEKEAKTYDEFACFCKDTTAKKTDAIDSGKDEKASLASGIEKDSADRDDLDTKIKSLVADIEASEKTVAVAKDKRAGEAKIYKKTSTDMLGAISALDSAMKSLKASKSSSLLQKPSSALLRDVLERWPSTARLSSPNAMKVTTMLLEHESREGQPEVEMENYKFHSDDIIGLLEGLHGDFKTKKAEVDAEEVRAKAAHDALLQEHTDILKNKNSQLDEAKKDKAKKIDAIATKSAELSTVSATLLDDQQYLMELSEMCTEKAKTWDQRSQVRQDELSALTSAIDIIKGQVSNSTSAATVRFVQQHNVMAAHLAEATARNPAAMEYIEAQAEALEAGPTSFIQRVLARGAQRRHQQGAGSFLAPAHKMPDDEDAARRVVEEILRNQGERTHSTQLTSLASRLSADPLAKVKTLIQELIQRLLQEANSEANQKGWCDKATSDATQKRENAAMLVQELNSEMAEGEANRDTLSAELEKLGQELADLDSSRTAAEDMRNEEKAENGETVAEANKGLEAVSLAIEILDKFYKIASKGEVSLAQQGPADDAPSAGFDNGEAYTGAQGAAGGILGMMDVIKSDFERTITETNKAEAMAQKDFEKFMTETGMSMAEKKTAHDEKTKYKDEQDEKLAAAEESLQSKMAEVTGAVKELLELKAACVDTGMSYEERVAARKDEMEALKKALCVLENYAEYGPDGAAESC
jgi:hypothetical protein